MGDTAYFNRLRVLMDEYAHFVYAITKVFPKDELYGVTSQFRRASLSVALNFIEGYARVRLAVKQNFWEISYGSLQESKYLVEFSYKEHYVDEANYRKANTMADEIGAMLWSAIQSLVKQV